MPRTAKNSTTKTRRTKRTTASKQTPKQASEQVSEQAPEQENKETEEQAAIANEPPIYEVKRSVEEFIKERVDKILQLHKQNLDNVVEIGRTLNELKQNLEHGQFTNVCTEQLGMSRSCAANYMNLSRVWDDYPEERDGLRKLTLNSAYLLTRSTVSDEIRKTVIDFANEGEPLSREEVQSTIAEYRKIKLGEYDNIIDEAKALLFDSKVAEEPKELEKLSKLSKKSQRAIAEVISDGQAETVKEALYYWKQKQEAEKSSTTSTTNTAQPANPVSTEPSSVQAEPVEQGSQEVNNVEDSVKSTETVEVPSQQEEERFTNIYMGTDWYDDMAEVEAGSLQMVFVEAPMGMDFLRQGGFRRISELAERLLAPSGFLISTVGHKSAMYLGDEMAEGINPLHLLTVRRMPGNTRSIVGVNIASASVMLLLAYKTPYRGPRGMLVDLQTEDCDELNEVTSGIENGVERFLSGLIEPDSNMAHLVCSQEQNFNIKSHVAKVARKCGISQLYQAG
jgi:hypothetical protein